MIKDHLKNNFTIPFMIFCANTALKSLGDDLHRLFFLPWSCTKSPSPNGKLIL